MKKYCGNCGADLPTDAKFCGNCGTVLEQKPITSARESIETGHLSQQPDQSQGYTSMEQPSKKSNAKILAVVAIIVVATVLAVVFLVLFTGGGNSFTGGGHSSEFVGAWNMVSGGSSETSIYTAYIFEANGDFKVGSTGTYARVGTWRVEGGILYLEAVGGMSSPSGSNGTSVRYSFSDGGRTLTLYPITGSGSPQILTKQ
jgi:hypothetical protein